MYEERPQTVQFLTPRIEFLPLLLQLVAPGSEAVLFSLQFLFDGLESTAFLVEFSRFRFQERIGAFMASER